MNTEFAAVMARIKESCDKALYSVVGEMNICPRTRQKVIDQISSSLAEIMPDMAEPQFKVVCDETNNPQPLIEANGLAVSIVPLTPFAVEILTKLEESECQH